MPDRPLTVHCSGLGGGLLSPDHEYDIFFQNHAQMNLFHVLLKNGYAWVTNKWVRFPTHHLKKRGQDLAGWGQHEGLPNFLLTPSRLALHGQWMHVVVDSLSEFGTCSPYHQKLDWPDSQLPVLHLYESRLKLNVTSLQSGLTNVWSVFSFHLFPSQQLLQNTLKNTQPTKGFWWHSESLRSKAHPSDLETWSLPESLSLSVHLVSYGFFFSSSVPMSHYGSVLTCE